MSGSNNTKAAGRIAGSPLSGLCERVCIETKKVFDGCVSRIRGAEFEVAIPALPAGAELPLTFLRAESSGSSTVGDVFVSPRESESRANEAGPRVTLVVTVPVRVQYTDASGRSGVVDGSVSVARDVVLFVPGESLLPYTIEAATSLSSEIGTIAADGRSAAITACLVQVLRVVATVELLVPSYGYCEYPDCREFDAAQCPGISTLPIFPPD